MISGRVKKSSNVVRLPYQKPEGSRKRALQLRAFQYAGGNMKNTDGMPEADRIAGHWRKGYEAAVSDLRKLLDKKLIDGEKRPYRNAVKEHTAPRR
jgi:hypothetical protein